MKKLLLFLFSAAAINGYAQQKITLTDAINIALKNSYDIQLAQNNIEISNISNNYGYAGGLPIVSGTASDNETITSINQKFPDPSRDTKRDNVVSNNLAVGVTGSVLLYNGMRVQATKKDWKNLRNKINKY